MLWMGRLRARDSPSTPHKPQGAPAAVWAPRDSCESPFWYRSRSKVLNLLISHLIAGACGLSLPGCPEAGAEPGGFKSLSKLLLTIFSYLILLER